MPPRQISGEMAQLVRHEGADEPTDAGKELLVMRGVIRVALYSWYLGSSQELGEAITERWRVS